MNVNPGQLYKPRIKPSHPIVKAENALCVGEVPGFANIIRNPSPWLKELLDNLDGNKTVADIFSILKHKNFDVSLEQVTAILKKLQEMSFIEDGNAEPMHLSAAELERYHRQMIYFSLVEKSCLNGFIYQERIKKQHIAIFGAGGWGSWVALNLCSAGIGELTLIDDDTIELSNLNRQILYGADDVGKVKVSVAAEKLSKLNPNVIIHPVQQRIVYSEEQIEKVIGDATFILIAWTNLAFFKKEQPAELIHKVAARKNIPIIEIGADPLFVSVGPIYANDGKSICFDCVKKRIQENHYSQDPLLREFQESRLSDNRKNLNALLKSYQSAPSLSVMGGLAADQIIKFVSKVENTAILNNQYKISLQNYAITNDVFIPYADCVNCCYE